MSSLNSSRLAHADRPTISKAKLSIMPPCLQAAQPVWFGFVTPCCHHRPQSVFRLLYIAYVLALVAGAVVQYNDEGA